MRRDQQISLSCLFPSPHGVAPSERAQGGAGRASSGPRLVRTCVSHGGPVVRTAAEKRGRRAVAPGGRCHGDLGALRTAQHMLCGEEMNGVFHQRVDDSGVTVKNMNPSIGRTIDSTPLSFSCPR